MTPGNIKTVLIRALARKTTMNIEELLVVGQAVFGKECSEIILREILADLVDTGLISKQVDPDGLSATSYELTVHGQHRAKQLG